jgi:hypothetical protein
VIPPVAMRLARIAFLFDVIYVSTRRKLAVATDDAATVERGESEEPNKTSHISLRVALSIFRTRETSSYGYKKITIAREDSNIFEQIKRSRFSARGTSTFVVWLFDYDVSKIGARNQLLG